MKRCCKVTSRNVLVFLLICCLCIQMMPNPIMNAEEQPETNADVQQFNDHYYLIFNNIGYTWEEAKEACENMGGHLVAITTQEEQNFIDKINVNVDSLWIGGYRDDDNIWYWVTGEEWFYSNWLEGEPNNSSNVVPDERYAAVWPGEWNDLANNNIFEQSGFICEWDNVESVPEIFPVLQPIQPEDPVVPEEPKPEDSVVPEEPKSEDSVVPEEPKPIETPNSANGEEQVQPVQPPVESQPTQEEEDNEEEDNEEEDNEEDVNPVKLAPPKIKSIKSTYQGILLKWSEIEEADSYTIKRNGVKIATVEDNSYLDQSVESGVDYIYQITADGDDEFYLSSDVVTTKIGKLPKQVSKLKVKKNKESMTLTWKKVPGATKYIVLRSTKKNGTYKKVATVSKTTYVKKKTNKSYYYKVVAQVNTSFSPASKSIKG